MKETLDIVVVDDGFCEPFVETEYLAAFGRQQLRVVGKASDWGEFGKMMTEIKGRKVDFALLDEYFEPDTPDKRCSNDLARLVHRESPETICVRWSTEENGIEEGAKVVAGEDEVDVVVSPSCKGNIFGLNETLRSLDVEDIRSRRGW